MLVLENLTISNTMLHNVSVAPKWGEHHSP